MDEELKKQIAAAMMASGPTLAQQRQGMHDYDALQAQRAGMAALDASQPMPAPPPSREGMGVFRPGIPFDSDPRQMIRDNGILSAAQTQYANDRPIQVFRPGIPNPIWGWGRQ